MTTASKNNEAGEDRWYVRRGSSVQGPYRAEDLHRYLLLGRVRLIDRVSPDGVQWTPLTQRAELIPDEMRDLESEAGRARFEAARRALEERRTERDEALTIAGRRRDDPGRGRGPRWLAPPPLAIVAGIVTVAAALVAVGYYRDFATAGVPARDCTAPAAAGAVWSGCVKDGIAVDRGADLSGLRAVNVSLHSADLAGVVLAGARLEYADLRSADLRGSEFHDAVLRGADLTRADLRDASLVEADLRFTDLRGARLEGADLSGARLSSALWTDGTPCEPDSVGRCRR